MRIPIPRRLFLAAGAALLAALTAAAPPPAAAQDRVVIREGTFRPVPIAAPTFIPAAGSENDPGVAEIAATITQVIRDDLARSGLFSIIPTGRIESLEVSPAFAEWRGRGADNLLAGEVGFEPDGRLGVRFRLWGLSPSEQLDQLKFLADPAGARRVAHKVADRVYTLLTGEGAYFDTRIVFVEERGPKNNRRKRLAIMDSDGANLAYLTSDQHLVLTPRFSPAEQSITFISYQGGQPEVYLLNLTTERQERLGQFPGMTFAPRFSPLGDRVAMSLSRAGESDIFLMDLATRRTAQLTDVPGIDTSPSFAPDGSKIVFESDRSGAQQLYVMEPDGSDQSRISFGDGRYANPVWSPRGDLIAFTKQAAGKFHIGVMRPDGEGERLLTTSFLDEGPSWAPNGRVLMFTRETPGADGAPQLHVVDVELGVVTKLNTQYGASDAAWSPLLR
ncbi:MAG: Tol-Pal system beta propeller repeat protein TolB [Pseudomonadota bacterium]